jgi:hypothetical protein
MSFFTDSGINATRASPACVSRNTTMFIARSAVVDKFERKTKTGGDVEFARGLSGTNEGLA